MIEPLEFTYSRLEEKYLPDVQYLFRTVFNKRVTLDYLRGKYNTAHTGVQYCCYLAYYENKPVAFYGAIPQKFSLNGNTFLAAHACDSFTLENFQRKGLHYELALRTYALMKQYKIRFVYAFHSENTFHSTKKLSWQVQGSMNRFHIPVHTIPLAKIAAKISCAGLYEHCLDHIFKTYRQEYIPAERIGQIYDIPFIDYKAGFSRHYYVNLEGCKFFFKVESILKVGFFSFQSISDLKRAISKLQKLCRLVGITEILFQVSANTDMYRGLLEITNPLPSWKIGYLSFEETDMTAFEFTFADLDTF